MPLSQPTENKRYQALLGVLLAASLWGISGTVAQLLFQQQGLHASWLVTVRLLAAGILLLLWSAARSGFRAILQIWQDPLNRLHLVTFALCGMLGVQYTFFSSVEYGNAATATLLQYIGPVFIMLYVAFRAWRLPTWVEFTALGLALFGIYLLVTAGSMAHLTVSPAGIAWGVGAAVTTAFYTLYPAQLVKRWNSTWIVGWAMLIGGLALSLFTHPWETGSLPWSPATVLWIGFVILFGTLLPFYLYLDSLKHIKPLETSLLASAEPLSAAIVSILWLHTSFGLPQWTGALAILSAIVLLSLPEKKTDITTPSLQTETSAP